ncbi:hypothetical protein NHJ13051_009531 [Beauveria bassiana]|uniref:Endo-1,3(4)-beta-glucanase 1 n=2 Tax=Beauveria bassiana TaxID=176275 RepID=A0A0A2VXT0_BEABA|nr:Endo-1,3(4)-beta-glucanase 1 [Beauveria bassiana D1-5]PQK10256.1 hypothetical protein BB8028_0002g05800 [Beauveria bassiana]
MHFLLFVLNAILAANLSSAVFVLSDEDIDDWLPGPLVQPSKECGQSYNPHDYVCHNGRLCPVINGEPLGLCGRTCFSKYMYICHNGTRLLTRPPLRTGFSTLRAENPREREEVAGQKNYTNGVDGKPMTACGHAWNIGGNTCSYCHTKTVPNCPSGNVTALSMARNSMLVMVPGGQRFFLTADWTIGYTSAHSAFEPPGSTKAGFRTYAGGGFFNNLNGAWGWAACGQGEQKRLHVRNSTNRQELKGCTGLNLRIEEFEGLRPAWQYE